MLALSHGEGIITLDVIAREPDEGLHTSQGCGALEKKEERSERHMIPQRDKGEGICLSVRSFFKD
jgi:hypothetical protein